MDYKIILSKRIGTNDICKILQSINKNDDKKQKIYDLVFDKNETVSYQAAWILTHLSKQESKWLNEKQDKLIDEVLICKHGGKRRLILTLINKQPFSDPNVELLNFCLEKMISGQELPGVKSLCMKIAYRLSLPFPELKQELESILETINDNSPAIQTSKRKILKAIQKEKK